MRAWAIGVAAAVLLAVAPRAQADWAGPDGWRHHEGWHGDIRHFDHGYWRGGHWWHGPYGGRDGWWWIVGPDWYWYAAPVYPYPDPYVPPGQAAGTWYWCDAYQQYYPYVGACPSGWRAVPMQPPASPSAPQAAPTAPQPTPQ
jgi:hypothetical protein